MTRVTVRSSAFFILLIMAIQCGVPAVSEDTLSQAGCEKTSTEPVPVFAWHPSSPDFYEACGMLKTMIFTIHIRPDGGVESVDILRGTSCEFADKEIARCIRSWCYEPAYRDGAMALVEYSVVINWGYPNSQSVQEAEIQDFCERAEKLWAEEISKESPCAPVFRKAVQEGYLPEAK